MEWPQRRGARAVSDRWCTAPWAGINFYPDGSVRPCCASPYTLGWVTGPDRQSLLDIWRGHAAETLRAAMAESDLTLGCDACEFEAASVGRAGTLAAQFDRFQGLDGTWPRRLEFTLSNRCNLACVMCHGDLSSRIREEREHRPALPDAYDKQFFEELEEFLPYAEAITFKGGEPFLAPQAHRVMDSLIASGTTADVNVTTNGTVWSARIERELRELRIAPTISVDAFDPDLLRRIRVGVEPDRLWANIDRFRAASSRNGTKAGLSYCLMASNWQELAPLLREADRLEMEFDVNFVTGPRHADVLTPKEGAIALRAMQEQAEDLVLREPSLQREWDFALAWIERLSETPESVDGVRRAGTEVPVTWPPRPTGTRPYGGSGPQSSTTTHRAELARELERSAGCESLTFRSEQGVLVELHVPSWAAEWLPGNWLGRTGDDVVQQICSELEAAHWARPSDDEHVVDLVFLVEGVEVVRGAWLRGEHDEFACLVPVAN
ncbi:MAG: radical SAM protein [Acidimicrobiales bacterium]